MKKYIPILFPLFFWIGCAVAPPNFTYFYKDENTGLDKLIDIDGYYVSQRECDSTFFSMYMFYPNGLFTIATMSSLHPELTECFAKGGNSPLSKYPIWGTYRIEGNLIKTQVIRFEGKGWTIFRDYRIQSDGSIVNVSDYIEPEYTNLGYLENYPSFKNNDCEKLATFYQLQTKRDSTECPLLKKKWFREKK